MTQESSGHAIPTRYGGCRFRSRQEARWAVFFDALEMKWDYEPQGFLVGPSQRPYLPDFYLPEIGLWVESKPDQADQRDPEGVALWQDFAAEVATEWDHDKAAMLIGPIPDPKTVDREGPPRAERWFDPGIIMIGNWHFAWCACPTGRHIDIQPYGRGGLIECGCPRIADGRLRSANYPTILAAYRAARGARFEHGESPMT